MAMGRVEINFIRQNMETIIKFVIQISVGNPSERAKRDEEEVQEEAKILASTTPSKDKV